MRTSALVIAALISVMGPGTSATLLANQLGSSIEKMHSSHAQIETGECEIYCLKGTDKCFEYCQ